MHLILLLLLAQQSQTAFRTEKNLYVPAVKACEEAEGMIASDPRGAIEKLDPVLLNPRLKKIECRLRIEVRPSEYSSYTNFFPYQFRGRARMTLAKTSEPEVAEQLLRGAVSDFKTSVEKGLAASGKFRKEAEAALARIRTGTPAPAAPDPLTAFRPGWQRLIDQKRFKTALDYIAKQGKSLTAPQRDGFVRQTTDQSRTHLGLRMFEIRRRFALLRSLADLRVMSGPEFDAFFRLPAADELAATTPDYDWASAHLNDLRKVRARAEGGEILVAAAGAAARAVPEGENVWFDATESLAYEGIREKIRAAVDAAQDAAAADRKKRRAEAEALLRKWKAFESALPAAFLEGRPAVAGHGKSLEGLLESFPAVLAELDTVDLEACFASASPEAELSRIESTLRGFASRSGIARESRRKLYTALVTAIALRLFLEGKNEAEVVSAVGSYRDALAAAGGPADAKRFGPRVEKVFEKLR